MDTLRRQVHSTVQLCTSRYAVNCYAGPSEYNLWDGTVAMVAPGEASAGTLAASA